MRKRSSIDGDLISIGSVDYRYAAFISYSHHDREFAAKLHRWLERYRIPAALGSYRLTDHPNSLNRLYPCFRDKDELSSGLISPQIQRALADSSALIIVCSRSAAKSEWISAEAQYFLDLGRSNRIFLIISSGQDISSNEDFEEYIPAPLREEKKSMNSEILFSDARREGDGLSVARLKLVSGIIRTPLGPLLDRSKKLRRWRLLQSATVVAIILIATYLLFAQAVDTTASARAKILAPLIDQVADGDDTEASLRLAIAGLGHRFGGLDYNPILIPRLQRALLNLNSSVIFRAANSRGIVDAVLVNEAGLTVVLLADGTLVAIDNRDSAVRWRIKGAASIRGLLATDTQGKRVVYATATTLSTVEAETGQVVGAVELPFDKPSRIQLSSGARFALIVGSRNSKTTASVEAAILDLESPGVVKRFRTSENYFWPSVLIDADSGFYASHESKTGIEINSINSQKEVLIISSAQDKVIFAISHTGRLVAMLGNDGRLRIFDLVNKSLMLDVRRKTASVASMDFSYDDKRLAIAEVHADIVGRNSTQILVQALDLTLGTFSEQTVDPDGLLPTVQYTGDSSRFILSDMACVRYFLILPDGRLDIEKSFCPPGGVQKVLHTKDDSFLITFGTKGVLQKWNQHELQNSHFPLTTGKPTSLSVDFDKDFISVGTSAGFVEQFMRGKSMANIVRVTNKAPIRRMQIIELERVLADSSEGVYLVSTTASERELVSTKLPLPFPVSGARPLSIDFFRNSALLASDTKLVKLNWKNGKTEYKSLIDGFALRSARFACQGTAAIGTTEHGQIFFQRFDKKANRVLFFVDPGGAIEVDIDNDCHNIIVATRDSGGKLYRVTETGIEFMRYLGSSGPTVGVKISANGKWALTSTNEQRSYLWHLATGVRLASFPLHTDSEVGVPMDWSSSGAQFISSNARNSLTLWNLEALTLSPAELIPLACSKLPTLSNPELTSDDRRILKIADYSDNVELETVCGQSR